MAGNVNTISEPFEYIAKHWNWIPVLKKVINNPNPAIEVLQWFSDVRDEPPNYESGFIDDSVFNCEQEKCSQEMKQPCKKRITKCKRNK
ncbi:MAG: hypothetical protein ACTSVI_03690 [Promethearchaeota archaeon]